MQYYFIDVILPIPLEKTFTYQVTESEALFLKQGMRVAVEFGRSKIYTALVLEIHQNKPDYQTKEIHQILDETPIITVKQLKHWKWIASYYMCSLGDVFRAALPSAFLLESETNIYKNQAFEDSSILNDDEFLIYDALERQTSITVHQVSEILGKKKVLPILNDLIHKSVIYIKEEIYEVYKPKLVKYVKLHENYSKTEGLEVLMQRLSRAKKQREIMLSFFQLQALKKPIKVKDLEKASGNSHSVIKALVDKQILEFYHLQTDRIQFNTEINGLKELNEYQQKALNELNKSFLINDVTLLHGVTSSGKTEVYAHLIHEVILKGKQVLFLLPEIALTTQIINRLKQYFGEKISVFHSKYSINERVEVYNNILNNKAKAQIVLGARSAVFLPFSNLGLIIVDEEHEQSYKQLKPNPRYNARDAAVVLGKLHQAKVLLGSATPSIESKYNTVKGKYSLVELTKRHGNVRLPQIELVDIKEKYRKKLMSGHFSDRLIEVMNEVLEEKKQIILFQNRRGFSPIVECQTCGTAPQCPNCDVSLTYHKYKGELKCHYCGYLRAMPNSCGACGSASLNTKGFGTEQVELELKQLFPNSNIGRMDLDTTRGKFGYQKIIEAFETKEIDILVGTQMLSKGLDFANVLLVGVLNADTILNFPDFRAHERAFQLLTQVSGRAGRSKEQGRVIIQSFNPYHQILQQVSSNNYLEMYKEQLEERWQFQYPPYYKLIKITLKHKNYLTLDTGTSWIFKALQSIFDKFVLGPSTPSVSRIRNQYIKNILIKIPPQQSLLTTKGQLYKVKKTFESIKDFRAIKLIIDVDSL